MRGGAESKSGDASFRVSAPANAAFDDRLRQSKPIVGNATMPTSYSPRLRASARTKSTFWPFATAVSGETSMCSREGAKARRVGGGRQRSVPSRMFFETSFAAYSAREGSNAVIEASYRRALSATIRTGFPPFA